MRKSDQIDTVWETAVGARIDEVRRALPADLVMESDFRSAAAGAREDRPVQPEFARGNRAGDLVSADRFWNGVRAADGDFDPGYPGHDVSASFCKLLRGLDIQQMSIASLIIALGLLVDDPVVAVMRSSGNLAHGKSRLVAAWLGPTKLSKAILYATITNIAAYLRSFC